MRIHTEFDAGSTDVSPKAPIHRNVIRQLTAAGVVALLAFGVAGCAPEPMAGSHVKGQDPAKEDQSWSQTNDQDDPALKSKDLPAGFPSDDFILPAEAIIDDAGQRGDRAWFIVLKAADAAEGEQWWNSIIETNRFATHEEEQADDGSASATLTADMFTVEALSIPDPDGSILLSYDITQEF